jgi:hypothetical protein
MYEFSFWLRTDGAGVTASFGSEMVLNLNHIADFSYTFYDFTVSAVAASTAISFGANTGQIIVDDVSVTPAAVPGPIAGAGLPGLVAACGSLLALWRRKRIRGSYGLNSRPPRPRLRRPTNPSMLTHNVEPDV